MHCLLHFCECWSWTHDKLVPEPTPASRKRVEYKTKRICQCSDIRLESGISATMQFRATKPNNTKRFHQKHQFYFIFYISTNCIKTQTPVAHLISSDAIPWITKGRAWLLVRGGAERRRWRSRMNAAEKMLRGGGVCGGGEVGEESRG